MHLHRRDNVELAGGISVNGVGWLQPAAWSNCHLMPNLTPLDRRRIYVRTCLGDLWRFLPISGCLEFGFAIRRVLAGFATRLVQFLVAILVAVRC